MRHLVIIACALCVSLALPVPEEQVELQQINPQENLDTLVLDQSNVKLSERNKRTIGVLRQLFPSLSQIIDQKIQMLTSQIFRIVGRVLLQGGLGGVGGATTSDDDSGEDGNTGGSPSKVSISLPTYPPDLEGDDDDDDDEDDVSSPVVSSSSSSVNLRAGFDSDDKDTQSTQQISETTEAAKNAAIVDGDEGPTRGDLPTTSEQAIEALNSIGDIEGAGSEVSERRIEAPAAEVAADQEVAASGGNAPAIDDISLEEEPVDENRNKRFLNFGFGGAAGGASSGSGGGSGNFLFDVIRLVAGSGGTEQTDEKAVAPDDNLAKGDGYTEAIPGPVTRLFVIANRGISNLIQDLILRIAQTSERIVNFKARLITSII